MFEIKKEHLTGIESIDQQHTTFFEIAESAYQLLKSEYVHDKFDGIKEIIQNLADYTKKHFADEEAYMESINYKRIFSQKIQHQVFIDKLDEINLDEIDEDQEKAIEDLLQFLTNWFSDHILNMDKMIG